MATKTPPETHNTSTFLNQLADAFGPSKPKTKPDPKPELLPSAKSEVFGIPETLLEHDRDEGTTVTLTRSITKAWGKPPSKGRNCRVPFIHLSRENPEVKKYSDDPRTANRWAVVRDGKFFSPRSVNREIDLRFDFGLMGSLKDCRAALCLTLAVLDPPIEAIACHPPDAEMVMFTVDPTQAPVDVAQAPDVQTQAPAGAEQAPVDVAQAPGEIPESGKSLESAETEPQDDSSISNPQPIASDVPEVNSDAPGGGYDANPR